MQYQKIRISNIKEIIKNENGHAEKKWCWYEFEESVLGKDL